MTVGQLRAVLAAFTETDRVVVKLNDGSDAAITLTMITLAPVKWDEVAIVARP